MYNIIITYITFDFKTYLAKYYIFLSPKNSPDTAFSAANSKFRRLNTLLTFMCYNIKNCDLVKGTTMKRTLKIILAILCLITCLSLLAGCKNPASRTKDDAKTVMTVDEYNVPRDLYNYFYNGYYSQYVGEKETVDEADKAALDERIKKDTEDSLKKFFAIYSLSAEYGISTENKDVVAAKKLAEEEFIVNNCSGSKDDLYAMLKESSMTYEVFLMLMEHSALENALYDEMIYRNTIDAEALAGDGENPDFGENIARVKHVLIKYEPSYKNLISDSAEGVTAAKATAEKVYSLAKDGTDFDTLVSDYGEDVTMFANTDGYYVFKGNQDVAYEEAAFALEYGEISAPVATAEGYVVILRLAPDSDYLSANFSSLITSCTEGRFNILVEERAAIMETKTAE